MEAGFSSDMKAENRPITRPEKDQFRGVDPGDNLGPLGPQVDKLLSFTNSFYLPSTDAELKAKITLISKFIIRCLIDY